MVDKDLLQRSEQMDLLFAPLGKYAPKRRLVWVDYKKNGIDMHVSLAFYSLYGMTDEAIVAEMIRDFARQGKKIGSIVEVDPDGELVGWLYIEPGYFGECVREAIELRKKGE